MAEALGTQMRIFLTGVGCVGKTAIGKKMGELLGVRFFDLDNEIESFFETSIERLQNRFSLRFTLTATKLRRLWCICLTVQRAETV